MYTMKRLLPALAALLATTACGTDVAGPSSSLLSCVFGEPVQLAAGDVLKVAGPGNQGVCLAGSPTSEFLYIPFYANADTSDELSLELTGAGIDEALAASASVRAPAVLLDSEAPRLRIDHSVHDRLRRRERRELEPKIRSGAPGLAQAAGVAAAVPSEGDLRDFNVAIDCDAVDARTGEVMYVSDHAVVYADTANPADLSRSDYAFFGATFDTLVHPVETAHFGESTDIDGNGRAILFFTRAVNEMTPAGSDAVTIGFFWSGDLFPETATERLEACPESNHGEMFYLIAPDPNGEAGLEIPLDKVRDLAIPLIGHEYQHLINASRRLFVNQATTFEVGWLEEALSHAAEEILYLEVAGLSTGQNLTIDDVLNAPGPDDRDNFNRYMAPNFTNLSRFIQDPSSASLMGPANQLPTRGAAWTFLRYAADRSARDDEDFFYDVVNAQNAGLDNLADVLGGTRSTVLDWMQDWTVSLYADDLVPEVEARHTLPTWNVRSIFEGSSLQRYPLRIRALANETVVDFTLVAGGADFAHLVGVEGGRAVIHVQADVAPLPSTLRGAFLRIR